MKVARPVLRGPRRRKASGLPDQLSHTRPVAAARFDDPNLISTAGMVPVMALAQASGLLTLTDQQLSVPTDKGANPGRKVGSLVGGMVAGADSIADLAILRHGAMGTVFDRPYAPSTLGSFLRQFTFGHVRQLDAVASRFLSNLAAKTPLVSGIDTGRVLVDIDDSIIEVHGHGKQGSGYGYSGVRGLNALLATVTTDTAAPVILGQRLRRGACGSPRGAARMVADALTAVDRLRTQAGGASGDGVSKVLVRGDSAFYGHPTIGAATRAGADVSVTVRLTSTIKQAIASIDDDESAWTPIQYTDAVYDEDTDTWISRAEVAEIEVHRVHLPAQGPPDTRAAGGAPHPRPATAQGPGTGHVVRHLAVPRVLHHHRPRRPRYRRRRQNSPSARHHRAGACGPEELRSRASPVELVFGERRLARLRGDGVQSHPCRRHPHQRSEADESDHRHPPAHPRLGPRAHRVFGPTVDAAPASRLAVGNTVEHAVRQSVRPQSPDHRLTSATPAHPRRENPSGTTRHEKSDAQPRPHAAQCCTPKLTPTGSANRCIRAKAHRTPERCRRRCSITQPPRSSNCPTKWPPMYGR
ncbi:putative transposase [Rhodococcus opacus B4]|uniref:Putative transposase n=1 Tax=Rhodococcus opacus (strain B4) TaxID=632772 RepID=C1B5K5_RHOOB|nr:putative transposase [Rhodococcus opacus B4]